MSRAESFVAVGLRESQLSSRGSKLHGVQQNRQASRRVEKVHGLVRCTRPFHLRYSSLDNFNLGFRTEIEACGCSPLFSLPGAYCPRTSLLAKNRILQQWSSRNNAASTPVCAARVRVPNIVPLPTCACAGLSVPPQQHVCPSVLEAIAFRAAHRVPPVSSIAPKAAVRRVARPARTAT